VRVKDGKIAAVRPINGEASLANLTHTAHLLTGLSSILDYGDLIIAPGLIDTHVHMNQPGRTDWEGAALHASCRVSQLAAWMRTDVLARHGDRNQGSGSGRHNHDH
jgi:dihydroorotase-like cyclic amidohydrolase